ncbi:pyridoxal phosphate-dependent aminotransferase [Clostridium sp.]|uniref:pyridoxal phosphate-dependent aminotransferase n=1 Tax=Clostridium sp. TaxID=1506 RepID=UPI002FDE9688
MIHGGDIYTEGVLKGKKLLDYSSNINPLGVPEVFLENIKEAIKNMAVYPDIQYRNLIKYIEEYIGCRGADILLGNGASELIDLSIGLFKSILIVVPSYGEYEIDAKRWNCRIEFSYLSSNMEIDYDDIMDKMVELNSIIIGNPNNPNGGVIDKVKFQPILDFCENNDKVIILDETFIEFTGKTEFSFIDEIDQYESIFIIRAMTKFFALPGIRFGYGITKNKSILQGIKSRQNPWNINCFAEVAAKYCLKDLNYIHKARVVANKERQFMTEELGKLYFIEKVFETHANFILCKIRNVSEEQVYDYCINRAIIIRKASNFRGLDKRFIRLAIKDRSSNEKLLTVLRHFQRNSYPVC